MQRYNWRWWLYAHSRGDKIKANEEKTDCSDLIWCRATSFNLRRIVSEYIYSWKIAHTYTQLVNVSHVQSIIVVYEVGGCHFSLVRIQMCALWHAYTYTLCKYVISSLLRCILAQIRAQWVTTVPLLSI